MNHCESQESYTCICTFQDKKFSRGKISKNKGHGFETGVLPNVVQRVLPVRMGKQEQEVEICVQLVRHWSGIKMVSVT